MILKLHKTRDGKKIAAICDSDLVGKRFEEKNLQLDLCSDFYRGEEKTGDEIMAAIKDACMVNMVGNRSVELGLKAGIIGKGNIIKIKKIPHAQAIIMPK